MSKAELINDIKNHCDGKCGRCNKCILEVKESNDMYSQNCQTQCRFYDEYKEL